MIIRVISYFVVLGAYIFLAISNMRGIITIEKLSTRIDHMREKMEELKNEALKNEQEAEERQLKQDIKILKTAIDEGWFNSDLDKSKAIDTYERAIQALKKASDKSGGNKE